eukprot:5869638-Heterocapsa_arctica.AAC.1
MELRGRRLGPGGRPFERPLRPGHALLRERGRYPPSGGGSFLPTPWLPGCAASCLARVLASS